MCYLVSSFKKPPDSQVRNTNLTQHWKHWCHDVSLQLRQSSLEQHRTLICRTFIKSKEEVTLTRPEDNKLHKLVRQNPTKNLHNPGHDGSIRKSDVTNPLKNNSKHVRLLLQKRPSQHKMLASERTVHQKNRRMLHAHRQRTFMICLVCYLSIIYLKNTTLLSLLSECYCWYLALLQFWLQSLLKHYDVWVSEGILVGGRS